MNPRFKSFVKSGLAACLPPYQRALERVERLERQEAGLEQCLKTTKEALDCREKQLMRYDGELLLKKIWGEGLFPPEGEICHDYYTEITTQCNLRCRLCAHGYRKMFQRTSGSMKLDLFCSILDKIQAESPSARVLPYHYCEPLLHPELPQFIDAMRKRGLYSSIASNFTHVNDIGKVVAAGLNELVIGLSGFSPDIYRRAHQGGDIETLKKNLTELRKEMDRQKSSMHVHIYYHMYKYNLGEDLDSMRCFVEDLGFSFGKNWARSIMLELTMLYLLRKHNETSGLAWFDALPEIPDAFLESYNELAYLPEASDVFRVDIRECPYDKCFTHIKHDGAVNLCLCAFDDRLLAHSNFLEASPEDLKKARKDNPLCKKCLQYKFYLYVCYADTDLINSFSRNNIEPTVGIDRKM